MKLDFELAKPLGEPWQLSESYSHSQSFPILVSLNISPAINSFIKWRFSQWLPAVPGPPSSSSSTPASEVHPAQQLRDC